MRILVACENSGKVRDAFRKRGHEAWSCDLLPSNDVHHFQMDVRDLLKEYYVKWDLMIAFPPCTHLCVSGARWFKNKVKEQEEALNFVKFLMTRRRIPKIAIENPIGVISTKIRKPDQIIQPYQFGHGETKATCLWLKNLPRLHHTSNIYDWKKLEHVNIITGRESRIHKMAPTEDRGRLRSITYDGIADAMGEQWG